MCYTSNMAFSLPQRNWGPGSRTRGTVENRVLIRCPEVFDEDYKKRVEEVVCQISDMLTGLRANRRKTERGKALPCSGLQLLVDLRAALLSWQWERELILPCNYSDIDPKWIITQLSADEIVFRAWYLRCFLSWDVARGTAAPLPKYLRNSKWFPADFIARGKGLFAYLRGLICKRLPRALRGLWSLSATPCKAVPVVKRGESMAVEAMCCRHPEETYPLARPWPVGLVVSSVYFDATNAS